MAADEVVEAEVDNELTEATIVDAHTDSKSKVKAKSNLALGKHHMVFMAQHVTSKG